jgi:hypothetical protein
MSTWGEAEGDMTAIDETTQALYESISFREGDQPRVDRLRDLFIPEGKLINNNGDDPVVMSVDDFIQAYQDQITQGQVRSFLERELCHRTEVFGKVAHRFSTYETRFDLDADEPFSVGINTIQLVQVGGAWRVSSIAWNDQTGDRKIPDRYLEDAP